MRATATESGSKKDEIVAMPVVLIDNRSDPLATVVSVQFSDVLGQLLDTVESLKALGLNVSRAEVTADENPNKFYVTDAATSEKVVKSEQIENIRMAIINNMLYYHPESKEYFEGGTVDLPGNRDVDANPLGARARGKVATKVKVEAMGAARSRLIVETADRPGLLVDIVRTLKDLSLNVVSAEIDTIGPKAVDTVYLTYRGAALNPSMNELVVNALTYYLSKKEVETDESYLDSFGVVWFFVGDGAPTRICTGLELGFRRERAGRTGGDETGRIAALSKTRGGRACPT